MKIAILILITFLPSIIQAEELETDIIDAYKSLIHSLEASEKLVKDYQPKASGSVQDADTDLSAVLKGLPFVDSVKVHPAKGKPKRRIVHLVNWHSVDQRSLIADIEDQLGREVTGSEYFLYPWRHMAEVEIVQVQQMAALRCLMKHHGLKSVFCEGLTSTSDRDHLALVVQVYEERFRKKYGTLDSYAKKVTKATEEDFIDLKLMIPQGEHDVVLKAGAVFRLQRSGLTPKVLEDAETSAEADPDFGKENPFPNEEQREDAIVERLVNAGGGFVLLGGGHDLSDNLKQRDPDCELYVVTVKAYSKIIDDRD